MAGLDGKWNSRRSPVWAKNGMVSCSQPLAAEAGLSILKAGGNAADAAVAISAALNVTQPSSSGIGGDAFCMYYNAKDKTIKGINGSGRCPSGLSIDKLAELGYTEQNRPDTYNPLWITVPGAAATWVDVVELFGSKKKTLLEVLTPAINMAEQGYPVEPCTAYYWNYYEHILTSRPNGGEMLLNGRAPLEGEIMKIPNLATTFRELAANGKKGFYEGRIAQAIVEAVTEVGGIISLDDLKNHVNSYEAPVSTNYRGIDIYELPPNGQGITALLALNILEGFDVASYEHNSAQHLHLIIECLRVAFADTLYYVTDPDFATIPLEGMLSKSYAAERRKLINLDTAATTIDHGFPTRQCNTVYFSVVDGEGNACSFINSNYLGFGTGVVPKGCGFSLHNRGDNFQLIKSHVNALEPNKRPYHTIIPGMAMKDGELWCPFGVMGGYMQPQGHLQVLSNMIDFKMGPQQALDERRVMIDGPRTSGQILMEDGIPELVRAELERKGHKNPAIVVGWPRGNFGTGQIILRNPQSGALCAGSDGRQDGMAMGW